MRAARGEEEAGKAEEEEFAREAAVRLGGRWEMVEEMSMSRSLSMSSKEDFELLAERVELRASRLSVLRARSPLFASPTI